MNKHNMPKKPPNSEFAIKYVRNKENVPRLSPIRRNLPTSVATAASLKPDSKPDVMAYLIHCTKHDTLAVYTDPNSGIKWLPFTPLIPNIAWSESALLGGLAVLCEDDDQYQNLRSAVPFTVIQLLEIQRVQLPQTLGFLTRMIFYLKLDPDAAKFDCCSTAIPSIMWITHADLARGGLENLWGPELVHYSRVVVANFDNFNERVEEFSLDDVYLYSPRDPPRNAEERMLSELNISEKTIEILYGDFLEHAWPCISLPVDSFKHYLSKYGFRLNDDRLNHLFLAFNYLKNGFVSFHELLMGLVSLEPQAIHHEVRFKFIFRYYDLGSKGHLDLKDFAKLVADMCPTLKGEELAAKVREYVEVVGPTVKDDKTMITFGKFMDAIRSRRLQGTHALCRSKVPVFLQLIRAFIRRKKPTSDGLKEWADLSAVLIPRTHKGICKTCRSARRYKLATHAVNIDQNGFVCKPVRVITSDVKSAPTDRHSIELVFNPKSIANQLLSLIRDFATHKGTVEAPRGLLDKNRKQMAELVAKLVKEAKPLLKSEPRLPNIASPCYVIGDIHGNIDDLLTLEKILWRSAPIIGPSYLFLGDYVDRGKWGLECTVYLIALKLLDPGKITLLRGNHEVRSLQEKYSYKTECYTKYGAELGERIWQQTNDLFDLLPVAATIDDTIFCTHGGLSPNAQTLDQIRAVPSPMDNPEVQSKIAWELLWSDPCHMQQYLDIMELTDISTAAEFAHDGYVYNAKRGAAYLFNERACTAFLERNGLSHMIRAHEVPAFGFTHHFTNLCTTVFSCSHYCGYENEAAVVLCDSNKIRPIRIDTHNNAPATD